jgi:hypothetical protein
VSESALTDLHNQRLIRRLTGLMFYNFAMTTDAIGLFLGAWFSGHLRWSAAPALLGRAIFLGIAGPLFER